MPLQPERIGPDELLRRLATPWIDMGGGRRSLPRKKLPSTAFDPSPNVVVIAREDELLGNTLSSAYLQQFEKPLQNIAHVPTALAWQLVLPDKRRAFVFTWGNWKRNSLALFQKSLADQFRQHGRITSEGVVELDGGTIELRDCDIIHSDELESRKPVRKILPAPDVVKAAQALVKGRRDAQKEIEIREFDDEEAHDEELLARVKASFGRKLATCLKSLKAEYDEPADTGTDQHDGIPVNGVFRYALWSVGAKTLYLAASHEDIGLPCVLVVGVRAEKLKSKRKRSDR